MFFYPPRSSDFAPRRLDGSPAPPAVPCPSPRLSSLRRQPRLPPRSSRHAARTTVLRPRSSARRVPRVGLWFLGCWLKYLSASAVFQPPTSPLSLLFFIFAPYYICQKIIPYMKNMKFGKIINISSDLSVRTVKNATEYSISKAGLDALTRSIAVEYGEYGIRANTININGMKGYTTKVNEITDIFSKNDEDYDDWKQPKERIPLSRRGTFDEFVDVIEFLCSEKSNYITGVNIPVDGGIIAKL